MQKIWVKDLKLARHISRTKSKRIEVYLTVSDIAKLDCGETLVIDNIENSIIITTEKYPIDSPLK